MSSALDVEVLLELWRAVASDWILDPMETLALLGWRDRDDVSFDARKIRQASHRLELLLEFAPVAVDLFGSDHGVRTWLRRPVPGLGSQTPLARIAGEPLWLRDLIDHEDMPS